MLAQWHGQWESEQETAAFGQALAGRSQPGDCLAIVGDMGAGKTTLSRAIAEAFGVNIREQFGSPTYTYVNEYHGARGALVHIDLYRVADEQTALSLGIAECLLRPDALVLVEWADKLVPLMPAHALWLRIASSWERLQRREWKARGEPASGARLLGRLGAAS